MRRRLLNLATALSLLLATTATYLWLRSQWVSEAWEVVTPRRPGLASVRVLESSKGRLVWVAYDAHFDAPPPGGYLRMDPFTPGYYDIPPPSGYRMVPDPFTPGRWGRHHRRPFIPPNAEHVRIPGVAEWYFIPRFSMTPAQRYIAVSWLVFVAIGAALPAARLVARWRRPLRQRPAFPVLNSSP